MTEFQQDQPPKPWDKPLPEPSPYIGVDKYGVLRVGNMVHRISLDSVVYSFLQGDSAETIQRNFPLLTLEQVYGAVAFYLRHHDEIDAYLSRQEQVWAYWRNKLQREPNPLRDRLRAIARERGTNGEAAT